MGGAVDKLTEVGAHFPTRIMVDAPTDVAKSAPRGLKKRRLAIGRQANRAPIERVLRELRRA
ncbi:MAG: hypothetical protein KDA44_07760 [Planctomycetales bacterium]|nr:hypothetical protein [Planctomycetales bacterium]